MPADDTQSSSWGSSQRPASHLRRSLAAAGRRSTRQTRLRTSEWMHQGGTMAHQQVHRSRWIACRRRSAAPSITISRLSRGKTVEKCTGSRPARNKKSPSRVPKGLAVQLCWPLVGTLAAGTLAALPYGGLRLLAPNISSSRRGGVHIHLFWSCRCRAGRGSVFRYPDPSPLMTAPLLASVRDTCPGRTQCCLMALARC